MRHKYLVAIPFVLLLVVTVVGGWLNTVDARGRVIDDSTGLPVAGVSISYGANRGAVSGDDGSFILLNLPRGARLRTSMPGYQPANADAGGDIRIIPGALTLQVNEEGTTDTRVSAVEVRQGDKVLTKCSADPCGQLVITIVDIVGQKALVCAPGHVSKEIDLKGVTLVMTLAKQDGGACPPLPSPSPSPTPVPTATPRSPSASP